MSISVSIVEDERSFRELLEELVKSTSELRLIAAYANGEAALRNVPDNIPDVLLLDLHLPRLSGIECARRLKSIPVSSKILVLTKYEDSDNIFQALEAGANGYILKHNTEEEIVSAIVDAHQGRAPMSADIAARVVSFFHQRGRQKSEVQQLSPREHEVLECLAQGLLYKEIADKLGITYQTVNGHIKNIYDKLHVHSRTAAVAKYDGINRSSGSSDGNYSRL